MNTNPTKQILKNHKLVSFLIDYNHIELVTVSKNWVCCTCNEKFTPAEVPAIVAKVGAWPKLSSKDGKNFLVFNR